MGKSKVCTYENLFAMEKRLVRQSDGKKKKYTFLKLYSFPIFLYENAAISRQQYCLTPTCPAGITGLTLAAFCILFINPSDWKQEEVTVGRKTGI